MVKLKRISKIDNFSIFKNFDWDSNLSYQNGGSTKIYDFKDINIFYGRNYSGKTSLSKIIRSLETKNLSPKYEHPSFKIELNDGSLITQNLLSSFQHPIYVYNSDFVKENLKFIHNEDENIESFSVTLGVDNQQILNRIQELKDELGSNEENSKSQLHLAIDDQKNKVEEANKEYRKKEKYLEDLLADKATRKSDSIKNQYSIFGEINYTITRLKQDIASTQDSAFKILTNDQVEENKALITQKQLANPPELSAYALNFSSLIQSTAEILKTIVGGSQKIEELVKNSALNTWVQTGHQLHKDRTTCAFCTNQITDDRQTQLRNHFDQETQKLQSRISKGIEHLESLLDGENFKINFDINHYYRQHHTNLLQLKADLQADLDKQKNSIQQLKTLLQQKNKKLFTELEAEYPHDYSEEINIALQKISAIRESCIQLNSELKFKQEEAQKTLRLNHVYHFLQDINYILLKNDIDTAFLAIEPIAQTLKDLNLRKAAIETEIRSEEDKLKTEGEACLQINNILNHDFGHQHLSLKAIETDTINGKVFNFEIQRVKDGSKVKAHNLSEGECSLIAFCYFLAKVQDSLNNGDTPIIWIDDPICSLDSNHIFFIFSLIEERICKEKKFSQLFISTHNLEFLKYLRRITGAEDDRSIGSTKEEKRRASYFLIQRHDNFSTIRQMPLYLSKFLTEFNFLFDQIYKCATVSQIDDSNFHLFYNFGNNARKFLEIYTFYKFPSPSYKLDSQLESFWGEQIYKTLTDRIHNEYSHMTGVLERGEIISEQPEMQKSAKAIINKIQSEDLGQYNALLESIDIQISDDSLHPNNQAA
ncbi:AAA family ATPase [Acinetobacter cumulans]|uniref:AAA family ATPase n=1 Tax=Acinetobacter cumulans TaxID=2136182 RepID=UPI001443EE8C|nr:AAA family ATPase [Acinetobacter cumulans]